MPKVWAYPRKVFPFSPPLHTREAAFATLSTMDLLGEPVRCHKTVILPRGHHEAFTTLKTEIFSLT
jgi:hypothetical protein